MLVAWFSTRWWDWCMSEDEKKVTELFLIDESYYNIGGIVLTK